VEKLKDYFTLTDRTLEIIERAIFEGSIKNGQRIVETEVAKKLGISKAPVREALKKLEGDSIVQLLPRKGYIVKPITLKSMNDFFDVMFILEPTAARIALKRRNDLVCREMDRIIEEMRRSLSEENHSRYLALNEEFHSFFYKLAENEWIAKICQMLRKQARILRSLSLFKRDRFASSLKEHIAIAEAYKKGSPTLLARAVRFHLEKFKENIVDSNFLKEEASVAQKKIGKFTATIY